MISIEHKKDCCGCNACVQICPHKCILMTSDTEGFAYPNIDASKCTNCRLCEKVCPVINQSESRAPLESFAAINHNEDIRLKSSSGGTFSLLAEYVINEGGVVFGAIFNKKWEVVHGYAETIENISQFRGSKYVQSRIGENYIKAKQFLDAGRKVLFSGTPCQIAGLKLFLRKDYSNLLAVDIICHGVPSPMVWGNYVEQIKTAYPITAISMRDKTIGWKEFGMNISSLKCNICNETLSNNIYLQVFLRNLCLRPSCYKCPTLSGKSKSDITIADFWGIQHLHPDFDDDKGCNLVLINSEKGLNLFNKLECDKIETDFNTAIKYNPSYFKSVAEPKYRKYFFDNFDKYGFEVYQKILKKQQPSLIRRIASRIKRLIIK